MNDIEKRSDIDRLMRVFYEHAMEDEVIGYIFKDVADLDLDHHLPIIGDFWDSMLFGTRIYQKHDRNPMLVHKELHLKEPLTDEHFERWLEIFEQAVDDNFSGERADLIKVRANFIAAQFQRFLNTASEVPVKISKDPEAALSHRS